MDRQIDRHRNKQINRYNDIYRQIYHISGWIQEELNIKTVSQIDRQTDIQIDRQIDRLMDTGGTKNKNNIIDGQKDRQRDKQIYRLIDIYIGIQIDRQIVIRQTPNYKVVTH